MTDQSSTPTSLRRRSLLTGAAWSVPVVAIVTPAPAFAASPCATSTPGTINFAAGGNYSRSSVFTGTATVPIAGQPPVVVTFTDAVPPNYSALGTNLTTTGVFTNSVGLNVYHQRINGPGTAGQFPAPTLTITFSRPVTDLVMPIKDLTYPAYASAGGSYRDAVTFSPSPTSTVRGANVIGDGSVASPLRRGTTGPPGATPAPADGATVTFAGPLLTLVLTHFDAYDGALGPIHFGYAIQIGNTTFNTKPTGCIVI